MATAWGFSVDDALISARVAWQIALGHGYRFNAGGPSVDCVTPLGWAYLLAPFARGGPERALWWASVLGAALWLLAGAALRGRGGGGCFGGRRGGVFLWLALRPPPRAGGGAGG